MLGLLCMNILGVITARGGSKRLPGKNIKPMLGKPLICWSIEVGQQAKVFDRFIVSTDDPEIASIAKAAGAEVPFLRPAEIASDTASSYDVIVHTVEYMEKQEQFFPDWIVLLEPTAPGRQVQHVVDVVSLAKNNIADSVIGISKVSPHVNYLKQLKIDEDGCVSRVTDGAMLRNLTHRNQDIPDAYYINSAIYAFKRSNLHDGHRSLWGDRTHGFVMDTQHSFDIDTPDDWFIAEARMKEIYPHI